MLSKSSAALFKKTTSPIFESRFFSASSVQSFNWDKPFLTSNRFVLIKNPIDQLPFIQLNLKSKPVQLRKDITVKDVE